MQSHNLNKSLPGYGTTVCVCLLFNVLGNMHFIIIIVKVGEILTMSRNMCLHIGMCISSLNFFVLSSSEKGKMRPRMLEY